MTREHRFRFDPQKPDQPPQDVEFSPSTVKLARKRQTENGVVYCLYCGLPIKHPTHEQKHHIAGVLEGKIIGIPSNDIRNVDNCGIVHAQKCHAHLDQQQKSGRSYLEVMRNEGRMDIVRRWGPENFLQNGEWIHPRVNAQSRSRGNHAFHIRGRH